MNSDTTCAVSAAREVNSPALKALPEPTGDQLKIAGHLTLDRAGVALNIETPKRKRMQRMLEFKAAGPRDKLVAVLGNKSENCVR